MSLTVSASGITFNDLTTLSTGLISATNLANGSITSNKIASGVSIVGSLSGIASQATTLVTASAGNAPVYGCRAWVNFDGTGTNSTNQTIRSTGNVSSVYKNGTGDYTVSFITPMADSNYSMSQSTAYPANAGAQALNTTWAFVSGNPTPSSIRVLVGVESLTNGSITYVDNTRISLQFFGN
jgi:hypothetical protein